MRWRFFVIILFLAISLSIALSLPALADADYDAGVASYRAAKYQEAFDSLLKAIDKNPNNSDAYYVMALTCQQMGKFVEARGYYQFIVDHFPTSKAFPLASKGAKQLANVRSPVAPAATSATKGPKVTVYGRTQLEAEPGKDQIPDEERIPFTKSHGNLMSVQAFVNKHPMSMLIDTGCFKTCFDKAHLKKLGIKIPEGPAAGQFQGADSQLHDYWDSNVEISLGRLKVHVPIAVMEDMGMNPIIGQSFLEKVGYTIEKSSGYICFYNKNKKASSAALPMDSIAVPFRWVNKGMIVEGKVNGVDLEMIFDTGASHCVFSTYMARRLGLRPISDVRVGASQSVGGAVSVVYSFEIDTLEVGPVRKHHVRVSVGEDAPDIPLIGQSFFGDSKYVIDNDAMVIRFRR